MSTEDASVPSPTDDEPVTPEPWQKHDYPAWKLRLFAEWFRPRPNSLPDPYVGRAIRPPGG